MRWGRRVPGTIVAVGLTLAWPVGAEESSGTGHLEVPRDEYLKKPAPTETPRPQVVRSRAGYLSVQVNVDAQGFNIVGDAANEPSIAVDPTDPQRIAIGWRQFDNIASDFRQAGWAYTADGGNTWTFPGVIEPGIFRSDPVLDSDADGNFYYNSLTADSGPSNFRCHVFRSVDGGATWDAGAYAHGGDKQWQVIDTTNGMGRGNIYAAWNSTFSSCSGNFTRSYDGGQTFLPCSSVAGNPYWGTMAVGPDGELYVSGTGMTVAKSTTLQDSSQPAAWDFTRTVDLDGSLEISVGPNPGGLLGQAWIAVDHSSGPSRGNVYLLASVDRSSTPDPLDVMFARSTDGGLTFSPPVRVNDDPGTSAWQWFGTMSVAPNGRIDAVWLDTRNDPGGFDSELYYAFSTDAGVTWSTNEVLTPPFDPHLGWPQQSKMGDYFDMVSDDLGANLAFAATLNGEQDVYFIRIGEPACPDAGRLGLDRPKYACDGVVAVDLLDCGLNADGDVVESVTVAIDSDSETAFEEVALIETHPASAYFKGSIPLGETDANGLLWVTEGDTIVVTYVDADDGEGGADVIVTREAPVECTPPLISNVQAIDVEPVTATVTFDTDEPTRGIVHYGKSCGPLDETADGIGFATSPVVGLSGLDEDSTYFFSVEAEDEAGNLASDDNGLDCYTFTTPDVPNYFTEQFTTGLDLDGLKLTFTPDGSVDHYAACVEPIGQLPSDPAGGTELFLSDDDEEQALLADGKTVSLYGVAYGSFQVVSNGYVTFASGETGYDESYADHFDVPRIAALFDDLNPTAGGTVSWKQLDDRAVATWDGVPELGGGGSNTFQIELHFDGTITISYLGISCNDAIVGLSEGVGLSELFFPTDLSDSGSCGPRPPVAVARQLSTPIGTPVAIALEAVDDGLPEVPGRLTYSIVSLPTGGYLEDLSAGSIIAVPHTLVDHGNEVVYVPAPGQQHEDSFTFRATDGGFPPTGGDSNVATVTVNRGGPQLIHDFPLDSDPGWSVESSWGFGQPSGGGSHNGDPSSGYTGASVLGYNLNGDYENGMDAENLTSAPFDLTDVTGTYVEYRRWLGVESASYDHAAFQVSTNGFFWTTVWEHTGGAIAETAWSLQRHDLSAIADGQPSVRFRWVMGETDGSVSYPGWNIDDVQVHGALPEQDCLAVPGEVRSLEFPLGKDTLAWARPTEMGGPVAPVYDVVRSDSASDFLTEAVCIESDDGVDTIAVDGARPLPDGIFYYLARAENGCGTGSPGEDSNGLERPTVGCESGP
jgi:hypothetical protein